MTNISEFKKNAYELIDWIAGYYENIGDYPVKSRVKPKEIYNQLPAGPPLKSEEFDELMKDFRKIIMPGITHWQHPGFFAYFPANTSFPSILGEMLTAALGAQCMKWETSPAAAELEEAMMNWLKQMTGLPASFQGVIQDSASSSTLCAILSARENATNFQVNQNGYVNQKFRVYCSTEAHSSVEKAVKIAGIGSKNLVKLGTDDEFALLPEELDKAIQKDIKEGYLPLCVVAALGTTSSTAVDPLAKIAEITSKYNIWLHVDAAYAGNVLILPEYRWMIQGIEMADSIVFNPHKWMFTNFDCSAYFVKDHDKLVKTFQILPEYLKTGTDGLVNDYSDWGVQLGRRFRALKLWFVLRCFGVENLQQMLRNHISYANFFAGEVQKTGKFELMAPVKFALVCFRYVPDKSMSDDELNAINEKLLQQINSSGKIYLSHTRLKGKFTLRLQAGQTNVQLKHVEEALKLIMELAGGIAQ
ncbi:MAG: aspartate aminotransferase family protein [Bacteroidales bacterium]|nr:aspartate aminotransferase family protein [Bacteroidales bacterium]